MSRAVFLDRDGTICKDVNYCSRIEDFHILPEVPEAVALLNQAGFMVVLVTNQSGISRGYFSEATLNEIHIKMQSDLARYDARVDAIYYCPHHPDEACDCRKPKTGMITRAAAEMGIDLQSSYMIGDMQKDIDVGKAAGCKTILVTTGPGEGKGITTADYTAESLLQAAHWIIKHS